jgi:hypothetical protein
MSLENKVILGLEAMICRTESEARSERKAKRAAIGGGKPEEHGSWS